MLLVCKNKEGPERRVDQCQSLFYLEGNQGIGAIFQKKGKEMLKKCKIFENLGKNVQNLKIF